MDQSTVGIDNCNFHHGLIYCLHFHVWQSVPLVFLRLFLWNWLWSLVQCLYSLDFRNVAASPRSNDEFDPIHVEHWINHSARFISTVCLWKCDQRHLRLCSKPQRSSNVFVDTKQRCWNHTRNWYD